MISNSVSDGYLAQAILRMSDFYIDNPKGVTPWSEAWCQAAQEHYYFPLNYLRSKSVIETCLKRNFFKGLDRAIDYGSGLSPFYQALQIFEGQHEITQVLNYEKSNEARRLAQQLAKRRNLNLDYTQKLSVTKPDSTLVIFSYSMTEMDALPTEALSAEALIIIEPSTQEDGRRLMQLRQQLIDKGFEMYAPCLHQNSCPLLVESKNDWCHDRIFIERSKAVISLEGRLPFSNPTLTYSYLACRKTSKNKAITNAITNAKDNTKTNAVNSAATTEKNLELRVVGDLLKEKGKTRQLVCRGPHREFLSQLSRTKTKEDVPSFYRGDLLELIGVTEEKLLAGEAAVKKVQNEIRSTDLKAQIQVRSRHSAWAWPTEAYFVRPARKDDSERLLEIINSSYRKGKSSGGWTDESHLLSGTRILTEGIDEILANAASTAQTQLLVALSEADFQIVGCVQVKSLEQTYFGMLSVDPSCQNRGIGKLLVRAAETYGKKHWNKTATRICVFEERDELVEWYQRLGYVEVGSRTPFIPEDKQQGTPLKELTFIHLERKNTDEL